MKSILLTLILCGLIVICKAQMGSVEKSNFGLQTGFLGIWVFNEARLTPQLVLRSELGLDIDNINRIDINNKEILSWSPVITLEPKWYYNLDKRSIKFKTISGNSGNFVSLKYSMQPDWFAISRYGNIGGYDQIRIIPTWGIRRNLGNHLQYESGIGLGLRYLFIKELGRSETQVDAMLNLHLRIGYRF